MKLGNIPLLILGESDRAFLFVHGLCGNKEEAVRFAKIAGEQGYAVVSVGLPGHDGRTDSARLVPWEVIPELERVMRFMRERYDQISIRATSIGAYFSLMAFKGERIEKCLFASPLLDMVDMIGGLMKMNGVTEEKLREKGEIEVPGQTLSYRYLIFARENRPEPLCDTKILYGSRDELIPRRIIDSFVEKGSCELKVIDSEHWIHTPEAVAEMSAWEEQNIK